MEEIKKDLKLIHIHVHLSLIFKSRWLKPLVFILTPGMFVAHRLSVDPKWQFKFNAFFSVLWIISMILIPLCPSLYGHTTSALIIEEVSLWANFASHFGALGANLSAIISDIDIVNPI